MNCLTLVSFTVLLVHAAGELVITSDFPDPCVIVDGETYHVYATFSRGINIQHATSTDLKNWVMQPDALPQLGSWANPRTNLTWAPYVVKTADHFTMYYTATHARKKWQCIGVATGSDLSHFEDKSEEPLICPDVIHGGVGAIDPYLFQEKGRRYLLFAMSEYINNIFIQPLNSEGNAVTGEPVSLTHVDQQWEGTVNEAPTLIRHGSKYVLFYSANSTWDGWYVTGYATSDNLYGPYIKSQKPLMTTSWFNGTVIGPGGEDVIRGTDGQDHIFYHGWDKWQPMEARMLYVNRLTWTHNGLPLLVV